ncbi:hypothetical protein JB92DRAFT_3092409 [Gautieria morchelliformis]|nr:hypothetical protein JB92DRAFT_3092409 [Gautieria morchelliformis]
MHGAWRGAGDEPRAARVTEAARGDTDSRQMKRLGTAGTGMDIDASSVDEEDGECGEGENEKTGEEREREPAAIRKKLEVSHARRRSSMSGTFLIVRGSRNAALGFTICPVLVTVGTVNCLNFSIRISNARAGHSKWGKE